MHGADIARSRSDANDLSDEEIRTAIEALTEADMLRLMLVEQRYRAGTDYAKGELLHAAVCQALMRERRCPKDVSFVRSLAMMMRSAGGHRRRHLSRQVSLDAPVLRSEKGAIAVVPADILPADQPDPEQSVIEREKPDVVTAILELFEDDEEAQYVIIGIVDGLKGAALQAATGLSSNQVHYALRKIRNRLGSDREEWLT